MAKAKRQRLAQPSRKVAKPVRNLTETERQILIRRLTPHMVAEQQAKALINATLDTFLATLGFPANVNVDLADGVVTLLPVPAPNPTPTPALLVPLPTPNGVAEGVPAA